jgi:type II secretory pathway pseudopilin PulG
MLKNRDGFGLVGLIVAMMIVIIMTAAVIPTFTAKMHYKQAKYVAGNVMALENAENSYMAKNSGTFANLNQLGTGGYLSSFFLQLPATQPPTGDSSNNWITAGKIGEQVITACIDTVGDTNLICPNNPASSTNNNGYFIGIYGIPQNYATYFEHEFPGSGIGTPVGGLNYVSDTIPIPSAPPSTNGSLMSVSELAKAEPFDELYPIYLPLYGCTPLGSYSPILFTTTYGCPQAYTTVGPIGQVKVYANYYVNSTPYYVEYYVNSTVVTVSPGGGVPGDAIPIVLLTK